MALLTVFIILVLITNVLSARDNHFQTYYIQQWGGDHLTLNPDGTQVQLKLDKSSGGAGFRSKSEFGSGFFHIKMKISDKKTGGLNANFFLTSLPSFGDDKHHFEIDFEFIGTNGTVQTNVYNNDSGGREQSFTLWFDPSADFHSYDFLWNSHQIVFLVDNIPIRVFKNNGPKIGYPNKPMHVEASLWNADWAGQIDWSQAPFFTHYTDFGFDACTDISTCDSQKYFWNQPSNWDLSAGKKRQMRMIRSKSMTYDYCANPATRKIECPLNAS